MKTQCVEQQCDNGVLQKQVIEAERSDRNLQKVIQKQELDATNMTATFASIMDEKKNYVLD